MIYINGRFLTQQMSGTQRFAFEMLKGLLEINRHNTCILIPPKSVNQSFGTIDWPLKIIGKSTTTLWEQIDLPLFLIRNKSPILINLVNTAPAFYKNQIVSILDMTTFVNPKWFSFSFAKYYHIIVPLIAKNSKRIITISENSKNDIIRFLQIDSMKINVLYCGVAEHFRRSSLISDKVPKILLNLKIGCQKYILVVSSLDPRKNFKRLIEAYQLSALKVPLVIVGSKGKVFADDGIRKLLINKKNIIFTGYVSDEDLVELYQAAKCFVYPSIYEGFGMPPLEAMASGCATIVSHSSSLPEVCGDACLYVNPFNIESISAGLVRLIDNERLRMELVERGFERIKLFSWQQSSEKLMKIIEESI